MEESAKTAPDPTAASTPEPSKPLSFKQQLGLTMGAAVLGGLISGFIIGRILKKGN